MRSVPRILGVGWYDHITNVEVRACSHLDDIDLRIRRRRITLFGHVARMPPGVPAHDALRSAVDVRCGGVPDPTWRRPRGQPRMTCWAEQLRGDLGGLGLQEAWVLARDREGWWGSLGAVAAQAHRRRI